MCLNFSFSIKKKEHLVIICGNYVKFTFPKHQISLQVKFTSPGSAFCRYLTKFNEMETWLQTAFKDSSYGDSGKVAQAVRITWVNLVILWQMFHPEKLMQKPLLSPAVHKIKSSFVLYGKHKNEEECG